MLAFQTSPLILKIRGKGHIQHLLKPWSWRNCLAKGWDSPPVPICTALGVVCSENQKNLQHTSDSRWVVRASGPYFWINYRKRKIHNLLKDCQIDATDLANFDLGCLQETLQRHGPSSPRQTTPTSSDFRSTELPTQLQSFCLKTSKHPAVLHWLPSPHTHDTARIFTVWKLMLLKEKCICIEVLKHQTL